MQLKKSQLFTVIVGLLLCSSEGIDGLKILGIFPLYGKSHFVMCETLAKGLAARGHEIDVYSHFPLKKPLPNYKDISLRGTMPGHVNNMTYEFFQQFQAPSMKTMVEVVSNSVCELMGAPQFQELFKSLKKNQPYDLVIIEVKKISNMFIDRSLMFKTCNRRLSRTVI